MIKVLWAVSTFQKSDAMKECVSSLIELGYAENNTILVCDDFGNQDYILTKKNNPNHPLMEGREVDLKMPSAGKAVDELKEYYTEADIRLVHGKGRGGVAINKNRAIKFFLENLEYTHLVLVDDDIKFVGPGLIEACLATGEPHMTGMLGGSEEVVFGADACPFFQSFPPKGETETHFYCEGSMGCVLWFSRDCIQKVGYMDILGDFYGFEHALISNRINALYGKYIDWFPILKNSDSFFVSQSIPNNYTADFTKNNKAWAKRKPEIFKGINLHVKSPGF